jgi:hypothetical protein
MNNISDNPLIWVGLVGIALTLAAAARPAAAAISGILKKSKNTMPEKDQIPNDFQQKFEQFPELSGEKGGSRKNSKKRNRKSKKRR